ncbi:hypothetical protein DFQ26_000844 [Actinomortierella ambigua]|nr:hypothetical protein DFQ26_000844 [Actinomortierella ambigua]
MPKVRTSSTAARSTAAKKETPAKKMSVYNQFMKTELPKYKAKNPATGHKEAFKQVAQMWRSSPLNPNKA